MSGRLKDLSYEGGNIITDENSVKTVVLTGNYISTPHVSATPIDETGNVNAYVTSVSLTGSGWTVVFRTSTGEAAVNYQAWGEIRETF